MRTPRLLGCATAVLTDLSMWTLRESSLVRYLSDVFGGRGPAKTSVFAVPIAAIAENLYPRRLSFPVRVDVPV